MIGKLHLIQLVEANLQLLIRIFISTRIESLIEKDLHISKFSFGSRKLYFIDKAILEKRLVYDSSR